MFGSYYEAQRFDPISAFGAVSGQASLAHEAIVEFLAGPIGRFAPWGEQTLNGWQEIVKPEYNYSIFPINAETLRRTEQRAFGNPVGVIGIMFRYPVPLSEVDKLFTEGPYEGFAGYAVYRLDDQKRMPTAEFLYLGKLADEGKTDGSSSYEAMDRAVKRAGGVLVYALPEGRTGAEREVPEGTLQTAVAATMGEEVLETTVPLGPTPAAPPLLPSSTSPTPFVPSPAATLPAARAAELPPTTRVPTVPTTAPVTSAAASSSSGAFAIAAVGLLGGVALGYYVVKRRGRRG